MLLSLSVTNFYSFGEEITLNMMPVKSRTMKDHIIACEKGKRTTTLPLAAVYGANASGKTNLVRAFSFIKNLVLSGTHSDSAIDVTPHRLDPRSESSPSRFEIVFKHDGIVYTYGMVLSRKYVHEEWLFAYYSNKESCVFERKTTEGRTKVKPGGKLIEDVRDSNFITYLAKGTRSNQLFLTEANEKNVELLKPVIHWFRSHLQIITPDSKYVNLELRASQEEDFAEYLSKFLHLVDTGINRVQCQCEMLDPEKHLAGLPEKIREKVLDEIKKKEFKPLFIQGPDTAFFLSQDKNGDIQYIGKLGTEHLRTDGTTVLFDPSDESDGTRRLMHLAPTLQDVWRQDQVFVIDELDRSLHTHLSRFFLKNVISGAVENRSRGQFIITTHDTNLLDRDLLRRDEIWFMEKDRQGASHLTSLAEYRISEGLNYENGYLNGRFGAIPYIGDASGLLK